MAVECQPPIAGTNSQKDSTGRNKSIIQEPCFFLLAREIRAKTQFHDPTFQYFGNDKALEIMLT